MHKKMLLVCFLIITFIDNFCCLFYGPALLHLTTLFKLSSPFCSLKISIPLGFLTVFFQFLKKIFSFFGYPFSKHLVNARFSWSFIMVLPSFLPFRDLICSHVLNCYLQNENCCVSMSSDSLFLPMESYLKLLAMLSLPPCRPTGISNSTSPHWTNPFSPWSPFPSSCILCLSILALPLT